MALEFEMSLKTLLSPEEIVDLILQLDGFKKSEKDGDFYTNGLIGGTFLMDNIHREIVFETAGINTNLRIWCWHDYNEYESGMRNILRVFATVLQHTTGDAVIQLSSDDTIKLLRRNRKVMLNPKSFSDDNKAMWRFKDITFDYEVEEIAAYK